MWYVHYLGGLGFFFVVVAFFLWGGVFGVWMMFVFKITCFLIALSTELCFPEMERPFPNLHHQLFQPLEPSVDLDTSSSSSCSQHRISHHSREYSKVLQYKTPVEEMLWLKIFVRFKWIVPILIRKNSAVFFVLHRLLIVTEMWPKNKNLPFSFYPSYFWEN